MYKKGIKKMIKKVLINLGIYSIIKLSKERKESNKNGKYKEIKKTKEICII